MLFRFDDFDRAFDMMSRLHRRVDQALDEGPASARARGWLDLEETDDALVLRADLPGVSERDLEVSLKDEVLSLSATRTIEPIADHRAHLAERQSYRFNRSFALPRRVDAERVKANLTDGVLTVTLAKAEAIKPRQITVTAG